MDIIKEWQNHIKKLNEPTKDLKSILEMLDIPTDTKKYILDKFKPKKQYKALIEETIRRLE